MLPAALPHDSPTQHIRPRGSPTPHCRLQVEELERFIDAPLHVLYMKQLSLLREKALKVRWPAWICPAGTAAR